MTEEQSDQLDTVYRAIVGEKANDKVLTRGLVERVTSLEKWKWLIALALFTGSATGNALGRLWI